MPKKLHANLEKGARKARLTGDRKKAYIFGTMKKIEAAKKKGSS